MLKVNHLLVNPAYHMMIIPFGDYRNLNILESENGTVMFTIDVPPKLVRLISKAIISTKSEIAQALSIFMYDVPMADAYSAMRKNWGYEIHRHQVMFIVVEEVFEGDPEWFDIAKEMSPDYVPPVFDEEITERAEKAVKAEEEKAAAKEKKAKERAVRNANIEKAKKVAQARKERIRKEKEKEKCKKQK